MVTFPIEFPAKAPSEEDLRIESQQAVLVSPHTYAQQVVSKADHWILEFVWPRMSHQQADIIAAWLDSLRGQLGSFWYAPRNSAKSAQTGVTVAQTAYSYAETVVIAGWSPMAITGLKLGQYIQIGDRLHRIVSAPANANGSGQCLIEIAPQIRKTQAVGTVVELANPRGKFRLNTSDGYGYRLDVDRQPSFPAIQAKEAL